MSPTAPTRIAGRVPLSESTKKTCFIFMLLFLCFCVVNRNKLLRSSCYIVARCAGHLLGILPISALSNRSEETKKQAYIAAKNRLPARTQLPAGTQQDLGTFRPASEIFGSVEGSTCDEDEEEVRSYRSDRRSTMWWPDSGAAGRASAGTCAPAPAPTPAPAPAPAPPAPTPDSQGTAGASYVSEDDSRAMCDALPLSTPREKRKRFCASGSASWREIARKEGVGRSSLRNMVEKGFTVGVSASLAP